MKIKLAAILTCLALFTGFLLPGEAQTFSVLYAFTTNVPPTYTNYDGANPQAGLILSDGVLFGTTAYGGRSNNGTVFKVNTNGGSFANLHSFNGNDGSYLQAGLILSGGTLYGTTESGGSSNNGTIFRINTDGSGFTNVYCFDAVQGANPQAGLTLSGDSLYGTTPSGGSLGNGTIFTINTNASGFTCYSSNAFNPYAGLLISGGKLYGTSPFGGSNAKGAVFQIHADGTGYTNLYSFTTTHNFTNSDGNSPFAGLVFSGNTLYGTTLYGGNWGNGAVFKVNTDGSNFTNLYSFSRTSNSTNTDGINPITTLALSGNTLYGTTMSGGGSGYGTVFQINTDGSGFTNLYNFDGLNDGGRSQGNLICSGGTLYGTTSGGVGGRFNSGTVFRLSLRVVSPPPPQLTINQLGTLGIISWPIAVTGWTLQTNANLSPGNWGNYLGQIVNNRVTNSTFKGCMFFRLKQ